MNYITLKEIEELDVSTYFLDMDGVIIQSVKTMITLLNKKYGGNYTAKDVKSWNFECCYQITNDDIEWLFSTKEFFDIVEPYEGVFDFMRKHRNKIIIVTKGTIENINQKRIWLDINGFEDIKMIGLPLNVSKHYVNMVDGLFIDDSTINLKDAYTATYSIMFEEFPNREWNRDWNGWKMNSWELK